MQNHGQNSERDFKSISSSKCNFDILPVHPELSQSMVKNPQTVKMAKIAAAKLARTTPASLNVSATSSPTGHRTVSFQQHVLNNSTMNTLNTSQKQQ